METKYLPYNLPQSKFEQLRVLAKIINLQPSLIKAAGDEELEAISGVILHRHLDRFQKVEVWKLIRKIGKRNRPLEGKLTDLILNAKVNPQWGIWSLSNEELLADQQFHDAINSYASWIGITASAQGMKDIIYLIIKNKKISKGGIVTFVLWGSLLFNLSELHKVNTELDNRSTLNKSPLY